MPPQKVGVFKDSQGLSEEPPQKKFKKHQSEHNQPPPPALCSSASSLKKPHTFCLSEAVHLVVINPAVDGEDIDVTFGGFDLHFGREPRVFRKYGEALLVELYQHQFSNGLGAVDCEFRHLKIK